MKVRKGKHQIFLFFIALGAFGALRLLPLFVKKEPFQVRHQKRPSLPPPLVLKKNPMILLPISKEGAWAEDYFREIIEHPWIQAQPGLKEISTEVVRDITSLQEICTFLEEKQKVTSEEMAKELISTLAMLQSTIPFSFPDHLYNVFCIPDSSDKSPYPYQIYQRLHLGESQLGFPVYLDVRVFNCTDLDQIVQWHFNSLEEGKNAFVKEGEAYFGKGKCSRQKIDKTHGFAEIQGERGVFIFPCVQNGHLYLLYTEAPWSTFTLYKSLFQKIGFKTC